MITFNSGCTCYRTVIVNINVFSVCQSEMDHAVYLGLKSVEHRYEWLDKEVQSVWIMFCRAAAVFPRTESKALLSARLVLLPLCGWNRSSQPSPWIWQILFQSIFHTQDCWSDCKVQQSQLTLPVSVLMCMWWDKHSNCALIRSKPQSWTKNTTNQKNGKVVACLFIHCVLCNTFKATVLKSKMNECHNPRMWRLKVLSLTHYQQVKHQ